MRITSIQSLEQEIKRRTKAAILKAQEQYYQVILRFIKEYYTEFTPEQYERTYQLYKSLVKSKLISNGNGYSCEVYFDIEALDYYYKYRNGNPYKNVEWSERKTLESAAHGIHGGYSPGTAIWDDPISVLDKEGYLILRRMFTESGLNIK